MITHKPFAIGMCDCKLKCKMAHHHLCCRSVTLERMHEFGTRCVDILGEATSKYTYLLNMGLSTACADWAGKYTWSYEVDVTPFKWAAMLPRGDILWHITMSKYGPDMFNLEEGHKIDAAGFLGIPVADIKQTAQPTVRAYNTWARGGI